MFIPNDDVRVARTVNIHRFEIFTFNDLYCENVAQLSSLIDRWSVCSNDSRHFLGIHSSFQLVQLIFRKFYVVQFDTRLRLVSACSWSKKEGTPPQEQIGKVRSSPGCSMHLWQWKATVAAEFGSQQLLALEFVAPSQT